MQKRNWNRHLLLACLIGLSTPGLALTPGKAVPVPTPDAALAPAAGADALTDALTCRISGERYPGLVEELRKERPGDFAQTYRQYSKPMMDLYQMQAPVSAWGNESNAIVIAVDRVMMAVAGPLEQVTARLEQSLEQSSQSPLSGALDDQHALVIFDADQPGLEGMVLLGCEYRIPGISLLDNPMDAWRKVPAVQDKP